MAVNTSQPRRWPKGEQEAYSEGCRCPERAGTSFPTVGRALPKGVTISLSPPDLHTAHITPTHGPSPLMAISTGAPSTVRRGIWTSPARRLREERAPWKARHEIGL